MSGTIQVNGETAPLPAEGTADGLAGVLRGLEIDPEARGIAIALNGAVVPRKDWAKTALRDGDAVEVVKLFAGG